MAAMRAVGVSAAAAEATDAAADTADDAAADAAADGRRRRTGASKQRACWAAYSSTIGERTLLAVPRPRSASAWKQSRPVQPKLSAEKSTDAAWYTSSVSGGSLESSSRQCSTE